MERTSEEAARLAARVHGLSAGDMMDLLVDTVGVKRAAELIGWSLLWSLQGETSGLALRNKLEARGMTQRSAYRAIEDFKRVSDALLALPEYTGANVFLSLHELAGKLAVS